MKILMSLLCLMFMAVSVEASTLDEINDFCSHVTKFGSRVIIYRMDGYDRDQAFEEISRVQNVPFKLRMVFYSILVDAWSRPVPRTTQGRKNLLAQFTNETYKRCIDTTN